MSLNKNIENLSRIASKQEKIAIGLMSGTSLDGLDIALCKIKGYGSNTKIDLLEFETIEYTEAFKRELKSIISQPTISLEKLCILNSVVALEHAEMVNLSLNKWNILNENIDFIASHGQTVYHAPSKKLDSFYYNSTLQIGDGDHLAVKTKILTISDFRQKHVAAGGEGAPLVTYGDQLLFRSSSEDRILLNIGGIANLTYLPCDTRLPLIATDTGPGNTLINQATKKIYGQEFDQDGKIALSGSLDIILLEKMLLHPFFERKNPKTTGLEDFNITDLLPYFNNTANENIITTLTYLTVEGIARSTENITNAATIYVSGGGARNKAILNFLSKRLPSFGIQNFESLGMNPDAKEALLFALLGNETLSGETTQVEGLIPVFMGKISFPC